MRSKVFLKANWLRLASANYVVDPSVLEKHIPKGTQLEFYNNKCYVSLVAFYYTDTELLNVRVPFHHTFEEINLRFYVKREIEAGVWRSEVAFTKLYFPKIALTLVAKYIYKENYETLKMRHALTEKKASLITSYGLYKNRWQSFEIMSEKETVKVDDNSAEFFFSKQYWGTSQIDHNSCTVYEIEHPEWEVYKVLDWKLNFDFNAIFGEEFEFLNNAQPDSVHLFKGSEVIVNKKKVL